MITLKIPAADVRGFNYHPSYSTGAMEDWLLFDGETWRRELTNGKRLFPRINTIRIWLSWNAYCRKKDFIANVRQVIEICRELDLYVIPCLFNRWHDPMVDCDGVYIDHFLPGSSWLLKFGDPFVDYIDALAGELRDEERILVWDVCNEPLAYNAYSFPLKEAVMPHEIAWLRRMADRLRVCGVTQPLGVGSTGGQSMRVFEDIFDVYLTHMYYTGGDVAEFEATVKGFADEAREDDRPLICSECCWGAFDHRQRVEMMRVTLDTFKKYGIGFVAHALQYSGCADLHDLCDGRATEDIGNLAFTLKDGSLRPYHEVFNEYC